MPARLEPNIAQILFARDAETQETFVDSKRRIFHVDGKVGFVIRRFRDGGVEHRARATIGAVSRAAAVAAAQTVAKTAIESSLSATILSIPSQFRPDAVSVDSRSFLVQRLASVAVASVVSIAESVAAVENFPLAVVVPRCGHDGPNAVGVLLWRVVVQHLTGDATAAIVGAAATVATVTWWNPGAAIEFPRRPDRRQPSVEIDATLKNFGGNIEETKSAKNKVATIASVSLLSRRLLEFPPPTPRRQLAVAGPSIDTTIVASEFVLGRTLGGRVDDAASSTEAHVAEIVVAVDAP